MAGFLASVNDIGKTVRIAEDPPIMRNTQWPFLYGNGGIDHNAPLGLRDLHYHTNPITM